MHSPSLIIIPPPPGKYTWILPIVKQLADPAPACIFAKVFISLSELNGQHWRPKAFRLRPDSWLAKRNG